MPAQLTIKTPKGETSLTIENTATIGRTSENTVSLDGDVHASRFHAVIRCQNGADYQIIDLGSRNGTFVNNQQVILPVTLRDGARIRIASSEILFQIPMGEEGVDLADTTIAATLMQSNHMNVLTAAILVCDVRSFSTFSEQLPPAEVSRFVGQWFRKVGEMVNRHGGVIDKFIGDAVLAYWTEPEGSKLACDSALKTAQAMMLACSQLSWPVVDKPMRVGVAMHYGQVSAGNVGVVAQRDATIIGDTVNTAFRLEGVMKELGVDCLCSESFVETFAQHDGFRDLGPKMLKGKSKPVRVFEVLS